MLFNFDPVQYEAEYWEEIWGCVKYIGIPYETVMNMPLQERKIWIEKHNHSATRKEEQDNGSNVSGEMLNSYAKLEMGR